MSRSLKYAVCTPAFVLALASAWLCACSHRPSTPSAAANAGNAGSLVNGASGASTNAGGMSGGASGSAASSAGSRSSTSGNDGVSASGNGGAGGSMGASGSTAGTAASAGAGQAGSAGSNSDAGMPVAEGPLFPVPNSQDVCPDPALRFHFQGAPALGASGTIRVFDAASASVVASVDLAVQNVQEMIGGTSFNLVRPVYIDGEDVIVHLPAHALARGKTYYVNVSQGALSGPGNPATNISDAQSWRFTTASAAPAQPAALTVAAAGGGDFCSVQGALDAVAANGAAPATITIGRGTYLEVIHAANKKQLTLHGEDRKGTVILGTNNNNLNPSTATRSLVGIDGASDLVIENLTIHNLTPQGGTQAEALRIQNCDRCTVRDADVLSLQDTLLFSGRIYVANSYIEGNVDFIWGTGTAYFDGCELKTAVRSGYNVQARNDATRYGYVFVDSKLTSDPGVTGSTLARIDVSAYPASHVAYVNCQIGAHITSAGWTITGGAPPASLRFWEYQSTDLAGNPLDVSQRAQGSKQLDASTAAMMRDPSTVLAGWQPK